VSLSSEFLLENLELALKARQEFPWAARVPEEIFLNDVLPYAVFDETRDPWRREFYDLAREIVKSATTATEAVQALNQKLFNQVQVHYNTGRKRPNQSPKESKALGKATCTGLTILLVDACRAVGIPARGVGTPLWTNERGNHTWVEIWDGEWRFTGADEYDAQGLNRGWFVGDAARARIDVPRYSIYATSWKRDGLAFPLVWARDSDTVAAVNVTSRYASAGPADAAESRLGIRLWDAVGGNRVVSRVRVVDAAGSPQGEAQTRAGTADLNDVARVTLRVGARGWIRYTVGTETREQAFGPLSGGDATLEGIWPQLAPVTASLEALEKWVGFPEPQRPTNAPVLLQPLSQSEAQRAVALLTADRRQRLAVERREEFEKRSLSIESKTLRWQERVYGPTPARGHSLWISMHGGGSGPATMNDQQWTNQVSLYQLEEGIYVAPRSPTDTWNMWHQDHVDWLFQRLIEDYVVLRGVDPDRVYLLGYSAGGDGVWQVAPRMADRFAAAAMMAGHPNEASLLGLRNLPFAAFVGGDDSAYHRNQVVKDRIAELDRLAQADSGGYEHFGRVYPGLGHWMKKQDAEAIPWLAKHERQRWPQKIVWFQDDVLHHQFYWLNIPSTVPVTERQKITAAVSGRTLSLEGDVPGTMTVQLADELLGLDEPVRVTVNGREVYSGTPVRTVAAILHSLQTRADLSAVATATVSWTGGGR
jgi:poly(3-hydroxybutyrate) depolymerase